MLVKKLKIIAIVAALVMLPASASRAALTFYVDPSSPWPAGWYAAAVADMQTVVNEYNAYGDFTANDPGSIYVYYNAGIPTAQSGYGGYGGSIGDGGTYPNVRVLLHESSHWLGTGTYSNWWTGPNATAMLQQFDGLGSVLNGDSQHYWPYGENYDNESSPINDARHIAMVYALREDFGIGSTAAPSTATSVSLTASDAVGTSGFNYPWGWSDGHFPQAGTNYSTGSYTLRTPNGYPSWTFAGNSLTVNANGALLFNGWGTTGVVTINNLILNGGTVRHDQNLVDLFQLAGHVTLASTSTIDAANGNINVSAPIVGSGSLTKVGPYMLTLSGVNNYSGSTMINAGTLRLAPAAPIVSYSFSNVSGTSVINDGTGGSSMNGTLNANGGSGFINTTGGPAAGMGALVLNGSGTTVDISSGVTDLGGSGTWTVSAWVKTTQTGATILNKGDGTNWNSGFSTFYLGNGNSTGSGGLPDAVRWGGGWAAGSSAVNNGVWHMVTYTDAGGAKTVYIDGVATSLSQNQFFNADTGSTIRIGFAPGGESDGEVTTNGSLSGINIFSSALSASQVAQLYTGGRVTSVLPTTTNVSIAAGAAFDVNGVSQTIGSLSGPAGSAIKLGSGGQLTVSSAASSSFAGNISGTGGAGLTKSGSGTLTLSGLNTYAGPTTISAGALKLGSPVAVTPATAIASYSFSHLSGNTVVNDGSGGTGMNGILNANGGSGFINATGGPAAGMGALVLNGSGTTVDINSGITDLSSSSTWTVSAWIKTTQAGATIFNKGDGTNWNSGFSTFYLGNGNSAGSGGLPDAVRWGGGWVAGSTSVNDGNWHLLTYTDSGGTTMVYVDGVAENLTQNQFLNADTGSKVRIGFPPTNVDGEVPTSGSLSGINIYNTALSPAQVAALYDAVAASGGAGALPSGTDVTIAAGATLDLSNQTQTIASLSGATGSTVALGSGQLIVNSLASTQFAGTISGTGGSLVKKGTGTLTLAGAKSYSGSTTVSAGTLKFNVSSASNIGVGAVATVASGATLELAGTVSALGAAGSNRTHVLNSSSAPGLVVSGSHQVVGALDGSGTTQINAGSDLTADHIIQSALVIGGTSGSAGIVTIAASDATGNPIAGASSTLLAGNSTALTTDPSVGDSSLGLGLATSRGLQSNDSTTNSRATALDDSEQANSSAVPEPTAFVLSFVALVALGAFRRRLTCGRSLPFSATVR